MDEICIILKPFGYKKQGNSFYKEEAGNIGIINIQKSSKSNAEQAVFTLNLGISAGRILQFLHPEKTIKKPNLDDCSWALRIGDLVANHQDLWFSFHDEGSLKTVSNEVSTLLLQQVVPFIDNHLTDEKLLPLLQQRIFGKSDSDRLLHLAILLKLTDKSVEMLTVLHELDALTRGYPVATLFQPVIERLMRE